MATPQQRLVVQAQLGEMGRVGDPWVKPHRIRRMVEHRQELPEQRVLVKVEDPVTNRLYAFCDAMKLQKNPVYFR